MRGRSSQGIGGTRTGPRLPSLPLDRRGAMLHGSSILFEIPKKSCVLRLCGNKLPKYARGSGFVPGPTTRVAETPIFGMVPHRNSEGNLFHGPAVEGPCLFSALGAISGNRESSLHGSSRRVYWRLFPSQSSWQGVAGLHVQEHRLLDLSLRRRSRLVPLEADHRGWGPGPRKTHSRKLSPVRHSVDRSRYSGPGPRLAIS